MKKRKKSKDFSSTRCPYCGSTVVFRPAEGIYSKHYENTLLCVCSRYPECDAYVKCHPGTRIPMGQLADKKLRSLRQQAHRSFNRLFESGLMTRKDAYEWLSEAIMLPQGMTHIGALGEYYCNEVIRESEAYLKRNQKEYRKGA